MGKPLLQPIRNHSIVRQQNAFQSERPKFSKTGVPLKVVQTNDLANPVTSNSIPTTKESNVMKNDKVIAPGMFRINQSKNFRKENFVPINQARASVKTKPITSSQIMSSLRKMSSEGNNIKLAIRNDKSEVVCATCKQCLITANHDECNRRDLPMDTPLDRIEVLRVILFSIHSDDGNLSRVNIKQLYGRSSCARALIEVRDDVELKDIIVVAMPKLVGEGFYTCIDELPKNIDSDVVKHIKKTSQTPRGVPVGAKVGFKPVKQVYRQVSKKNNVDTSSTKKKDAEPTIEVSNSNPFDVLNSVENDVDLGTNGGTSNLAKRLIIDGKVILVDDEGKPLTKVDSLGDHDSENEVASVDNDMANFLASKKVVYGTNSLLEQWKECYVNGDYDFIPYDDDMYEAKIFLTRFKTFVIIWISKIEVVRRNRNGADVAIPLESIRAISEQFANTTYSFFLGKR
ncbi:hypothetical protein Tco_0812807 [Tanacetum coccineum]